MELVMTVAKSMSITEITYIKIYIYFIEFVCVWRVCTLLSLEIRGC